MARKVAAAPEAARTMSDEHKAALAEGREHGRAVRRYLEALGTHRPKRGRRRTADDVRRRLAAIDEEMAGADALARLHLTQERLDLGRDLEATGDGGARLAALEAEFVRVAAAYSRRKGITYDSWRAAGVEARVLRAAGIGRGR
jgi:hypothetical protein